MRVGWLVSALPIPKWKRCGFGANVHFCEWLGFSRVAKVAGCVCAVAHSKGNELAVLYVCGLVVGECAADSETETLRIFDFL